MKKLIVVFLFVLTASALSAATGVDYFHSDWEEARKIAVEKDKPLYVHFTTEWCGWCRKIEKEVYKSEKGKKALEPYVPVSLDCTRRNKSGQELQQAQKNIQLMQKWGGSGYPYLVMVTPEGVVFDSFSGYRPVPAFEKKLEDALTNLEQFRAFQEKAESADPNSYEFNLEAMKVYSGVQQHEEALQAANRVLKLDPENERNNAARAAMTRFEALQKLGRNEKLSKALGQVQQFDPENKKGLWEDGATAYASTLLQKSRGKGTAWKRQNFERGAAALETLTSADVELDEPQKAHYFLGILYAQNGERDDALQALKKALAIAPESRTAQHIQKTINALENAK